MASLHRRHSLALPESAAREALDFIEFLEQRYGPPTAIDDEPKCQAALAHIAAMRIDWQGKPVSSRDALYDHARG